MTTQSDFDFWRYATLRPYGSSMMTPLAALWLAFSFVIILLMSLVEGTVWATVSQYFVPQSIRWLAVILAPLFFVGIFAVIWIVDVSFITSEKPFRSTRRPVWSSASDVKGLTARTSDAPRFETLRWWFGVAVRLAIVFISLLITAPFLTQVIRSDEIRDVYQAEVAAKRAAKEQELVRLQDQAIEAAKSRREQLDKERQALEKEADTIRQDRAPTIKDYEREAAAYQQEFEDERAGVGGRRPGIGSKAREALAAVEAARAQARYLRAERDRALAPITEDLAGKRESLGAIDRQIADLTAKRQKIQAESTALSLPAFAQGYDLDIPADTIGTRVRILETLRQEDRRLAQGALDHFKTIEGLSQALLGILFLSLIALKIFEPRAVRFYLNDTLQQQWRHYRNGYYSDIPGFASETGKQLLDPVSFADAYLNTDPLSWRRQAQLDHLRQEQEIRKLELEERRVKGRADLEHYKQTLGHELEEEKDRRLHKLEQEKHAVENEYREQIRRAKAETDRMRGEAEARVAAKIAEIESTRAAAQHRLELERQETQIKIRGMEQRNQRLQKRIDLLIAEQEAKIEASKSGIKRRWW
ncbi:DUF4407 domain-containing protein [Candidatus Thiosymbion oneisti]|uniref:DUF4407 domain-containing protein n=1 Tax=Candidatus Thiosymbion oneisti TaxID=589554 RepID=UPI00105B2C1E|nr:DUF4407 domain-containing protein [Candidatus Thiosymbion oneisti]